LAGGGRSDTSGRKRKAPRGRRKPGTRRRRDRWWLYAALCADGTLYVGIAKDVARRIECHNAGRGARYTRTRRPIALVHSEPCGDMASALRREREVKRWSRPTKVARLGLDVPGRRPSSSVAA
jgi:putative endonuclease